MSEKLPNFLITVQIK